MESRLERLFYGQPTQELIEIKIASLSVNSVDVWRVRWVSDKPVLQRISHGRNELKTAKDVPTHYEECSERCASYMLTAIAAVKAYNGDRESKTLKLRGLMADTTQETMFENGHMVTEISLIVTRVS